MWFCTICVDGTLSRKKVYQPFIGLIWFKCYNCDQTHKQLVTRACGEKKTPIGCSARVYYSTKLDRVGRSAQVPWYTRAPSTCHPNCPKIAQLKLLSVERRGVIQKKYKQTQAYTCTHTEEHYRIHTHTETHMHAHTLCHLIWTVVGCFDSSCICMLTVCEHLMMM